MWVNGADDGPLTFRFFSINQRFSFITRLYRIIEFFIYNFCFVVTSVFFKFSSDSDDRQLCVIWMWYRTLKNPWSLNNRWNSFSFSVIINYKTSELCEFMSHSSGNTEAFAYSLIIQHADVSVLKNQIAIHKNQGRVVMWIKCTNQAIGILFFK